MTKDNSSEPAETPEIGTQVAEGSQEASSAGEAAISVKIDELGPCKRSVSITVPASKVDAKFEEAYKELGQTVALPGFRRGRVPRALLEKRFGEQVMGDLREQLVEEAMGEALEQGKLKPLGKPKVQEAELPVSAGQDLSFTVVLEIEPQFDLPDYKGLPLEAQATAVEEKEIDEALERVRTDPRRGELVSVEEGGVKHGDRLIVDAKAVSGGALIQEAKGADFWTHGQAHGDHFHAPSLLGFELGHVGDQLEGKTPGQTVSFEVTVPKEHARSELRGHAAELELTIREIKRVQHQPADDDFAKNLGFDDLAALRADIKARLQAQKDVGEMGRQEQACVDSLLQKSTMELPEEFVNAETERFIQRQVLRLYYAGLPEKEVEAQVKELRDSGRDTVKKGLRSYFLLEKIAEKEGVFATESDVEARIETIAEHYGRMPYEIREDYEKRGMMNQLRAEIRADKVRALLREKASVSGGAGGKGN